MKSASFVTTELPVEVTAVYLKCCNVNVTLTTIEKDLQDHPDYPSLLSISDVLQNYGVENIAFESQPEKLNDLPVPFITRIKNQRQFQEVFTIVSRVAEDSVTYYDPEKSKWKTIKRQAFLTLWEKGITLISDASEAFGERNYKRQLALQNQKKAISCFSWLSIPLILLLAGIWRLFPHETRDLYRLAFFLTAVTGSVIGLLLLWYEVDEFNPVVQRICTGGKKVNCNAVLNSGASKVAGISWSTVGFAYFAGGAITLSLNPIPVEKALFLQAWLNTIACPYILFSLYYQWKVAKQWCTLCLTVQALLLTQLTLSLLAGWHALPGTQSALDVQTLLTFLFNYLLPFAIVNLLQPLYRTAKEFRSTKLELQRLKHTPEVFDALLRKQPILSENTDGLGILLGNPNARHKIVKVCNPNCAPCARSHLALKGLLEIVPDLQLQIIYLASNNEKDINRMPVKHFLAVAAQNDSQLTEKALHDWYSQDIKDYEAFAAKYPMNGKLSEQENKVTAMYDWCLKMKIAYTPTVFLNGFQLPPTNDLTQLKYFLAT